MTKYYQYRSICIEINRHDNVVITTTSVTKCIFLKNFGAIPKRMVKVAKLKLQCRVHNIYLQKYKLNKVFTEKKYLQKKNKRKLKIPTLFIFLFFPYPLFPPSFSPLAFDISCKILKHTFSKEIIGTP